jgi:LEA14-like dessication related protein
MDYKKMVWRILSLNFMKKIGLFSFSILVFILSSCIEYKEVQYKGIQNVKIIRLKDGSLTVSLDVIINNPNNYAIKIRPSNFQLAAPNEELGTIRLDKSLNLEKNTEQTYSVIVKGDLKDASKNGLATLIGWTLKKQISLRLLGKLKVSAKGFLKSFPVDETRSFKPSELGIGNFNGF